MHGNRVKQNLQAGEIANVFSGHNVSSQSRRAGLKELIITMAHTHDNPFRKSVLIGYYGFQ